MSAMLKFSSKLTRTDPTQNNVIIIGSKASLSNVDYNEIKIKFGEKVPKELYESVVERLGTSADTIPLYLKNIVLSCLPTTCSRHNTESQSLTVTKFVRNFNVGDRGSIVIVCEYKHVLASACAVARCFPVYNRKKNQCNRQSEVSVEFLTTSADGTRIELTNEDLICLTLSAKGIQEAGRIVDTPCSEMNTDDFVKAIEHVANDLNIVPKIIRGEDLEAEGLGAIYHVGKAAVHPPAMVVLSHTPPQATKTIAWVGKGIVYDTGGLSIKSRVTMCGMKRDCGGAAAVLGAYHALVSLGFKENLHAVFCLAENAIGPNSLRPDDVITMYSGKTVEVNNTDAEGRLVLGDGVAYAKKDLKADIILDMATLTGSQGSATGKFHGAVLTNSESWEDLAVKAGRASGDLLHPVVFTPEIHFSEFNSTIADMKNSVGDYANASVSCGGLFIMSHIGFDFEGDFIHIDMSKTAHAHERATSYGVALLMALFGNYSANPMLQFLCPAPSNVRDKH